MISVQHVAMSNSIQVYNFESQSEFLGLYFENSKRSGGGEIVEDDAEINVDEGYAILRFHDAAGK